MMISMKMVDIDVNDAFVEIHQLLHILDVRSNTFSVKYYLQIVEIYWVILYI